MCKGKYEGAESADKLMALKKLLKVTLVFLNLVELEILEKHCCYEAPQF